MQIADEDAPSAGQRVRAGNGQPDRLARQDLAAAFRYVDLLRRGGAAPGLVAFNAFICKLAAANLEILRDQGLGAKLVRTTVVKIAAEVAGESAGLFRPSVGPR